MWSLLLEVFFSPNPLLPDANSVVIWNLSGSSAAAINADTQLPLSEDCALSSLSQAHQLSQPTVLVPHLLSMFYRCAADFCPPGAVVGLDPIGLRKPNDSRRTRSRADTLSIL